MFSKTLLISAAFLGSALGLAMPVAYGADIRYEATPTPHFVVDGNTPLAVFKRFEDLWLVTSDDSLNLPATLPKNLAVIEKEQLYVPKGAGVRMSFSVLSDLRVTRDGGNWNIFLNQPSTPSTLPLPLEAQSQTVTIDGASLEPRRATSFDTRETYTAIPVLENAGFPEPENVGVLRRLQSNVGGVFVSSNGAPLGMTTENGKTVFKAMNNAISEAVAKREEPINLSIVDTLLDAARDAGGAPVRPSSNVFLPNRGPLPSIQAPTIDMENETTVDNAVARMNRALSSVDSLSYPLGGDEPAPKGTVPFVPADGATVPMVADDAPTLDAAPLPNMDDPVAMALAARDKATVPPAIVASAGTAPQALPESKLLPNFGDRNRRELEALERRLGERWYFAEKNTDKIAAANRFAGLKIFMQQYPEALGILRTVIEQNQNTDPALIGDTKMLEGVALALMGRYPEAEEQISKIKTPSVDKAIWSGYVQEGMGAHKKAIELLDDTIEKAAAYPPLVTQQIRYAYAKALFNQGRLNEALNQIDRLALLGGHGRVLPQAQLLMGRIYQEQKQPDLAEQVFITLASNSDLQVSSEALYYFLNLLTDRGDLTPEAAAIRFENLRFLWRGDEVEENSLFKLANLYTQSKNYKQALERLKYLTVNFPDSKYVPQAAAMMTKIFSDLFLERRQDVELDPLGMLGLYYDFRELTPADTEGDQVVTNVATRLANLGLYDRAAETLERQLRFRAKDPVAVGRLGLALAGLHFENFAPGEGLEALKKTDSSKLPDDLKNDRLMMRAKLLGLALKFDQALALAKQATGPQAQDLQAEFAWELGDHKAVIAAMTPRFDAAGGTDWTGEDVTRFLRLATSLAAERKARTLKDLSIRYEQGIKLHELTDQVDFLIQAARVESPAESKPEAALATPQTLAPGASVWKRAELALKDENDFARDYRRLRTQWIQENAQADRSELDALQKDAIENQPRFR